MYGKSSASIALGFALAAVALCCAILVAITLKPPQCTEVVPPVDEPAIITKGVIFIHGGRFIDQDQVLILLNATGRERPRVGIIPTASDDPINTGLRWVRYLEKFGAEAVLLNITVDNCVWTSHDKDLVELVRSLDAVLFLGGFPDRYVKCFLPNGLPTPVLSAIWELYLRGGVVAGRSAGAVFLSDYGVLGGFDVGYELVRGFGILGHKLAVDVHYLASPSTIRLFEVMTKVPVSTGLAIGEDMAVLCRGTTCRVIGPGPVLLLVYEGLEDEKYVFSLSYLTDGDEFTLAGDHLRAAPGKTLLSKGLLPGEPSTDLGTAATSPEDWIVRAFDRLINSSRVQLKLIPLRGGATVYYVELSRTPGTAIYDSGVSGRYGLTRYTVLRLRLAISRVPEVPRIPMPGAQT